MLKAPEHIHNPFFYFYNLSQHKHDENKLRSLMNPAIRYFLKARNFKERQVWGCYCCTHFVCVTHCLAQIKFFKNCSVLTAFCFSYSKWTDWICILDIWKKIRKNVLQKTTLNYKSTKKSERQMVVWLNSVHHINLWFQGYCKDFRWPPNVSAKSSGKGCTLIQRTRHDV